MMDAMPRRANHEGTQPHKVPGRDLFRTQVMVNGRRVAVYGKTASEAAAARRKLVGDLEGRRKPTDPKYTVGDWLTDWTDFYLTNLSVRTVASYKDTVRLYIRPAIGDIRLAKLHQDDISRMLAGLVGKRRPISTTNRRYVLTVLHIALAKAMEQDRISRNVAELVVRPAKAQRVVTALDAATEAALYAKLAEHEHRAMMLVLLTCGLREGELLGLTWRAVNLDKATLEVRGQLARGTRLIAEPKRASRRMIDLPPQTVEALRELKVKQNRLKLGKKDWHPAGLVFTTDAGQPRTHGMPRRVLRSLLKELGLPLATTHQLRHTYVTDLLEDGVPLNVVSKLVGHKSVATTSDQYGHLTDRQRKDAADAMANRLARRAK